MPGFSFRKIAQLYLILRKQELGMPRHLSQELSTIPIRKKQKT